MRFRRLAAAAALSVLGAAHAAAQEPVDLAMIGRIRAEALDRSQVMRVFDQLTNVLGPRLTGTPAYNAAAEWARDELTRWGLQGARLEPFAFGRGWTLEKLTLEMTAPRYFPLFGYPEAWTPATRGAVVGTPVYLGDATAAEIEAMGEKLRGAIVLTDRPQEWFAQDDRVQPADSDTAVRIGAPRTVGSGAATSARQMQGLLQRFGAAAMLRPSYGEHGTAFVLGQRNTSDDATPSVRLIAEHYNTIVRLLQAGRSVTLRVEVGARYDAADSSTYNVVAEIPGTDPVLRDEVVLIGAHLDSWHSSNGATDNADGVAGAMEAMRVLQALGVRPRRTIRVALWSGEEQGLLGSRAYVAQHLATPEARAKTSVYFNDDPGTGATFGFYSEDNAAAKAIFDAWLAPLADLGVKRNVIDGIGSTDHLSFSGVGVPGFTAIKDYVHYDARSRHSNTDFYERVREADLKQSAVVMAVFAYHAAMRNEQIPRAAARR